MSIAYFSPGMTVAQLKKEYHALAMRWHPDRGGDTATMQAINEAYQRALAAADGSISYDENDEPHEYHYNAEREQAVVDFIDRLIKSGALQPTVDCWLIGTWVWIQGDTKPVKELLKALECKWHSKRACWYWHPDDGRKWHYNRNASLDGLAAAYGASRLTGTHREDAERIAA